MTGLCLLCPLPISVLVVTGLCPIMHYGQYPLLLIFCCCVCVSSVYCSTSCNWTLCLLCPRFLQYQLLLHFVVNVSTGDCSNGCYCHGLCGFCLHSLLQYLLSVDFVGSVSAACCSTCCQWTSWFLCLLPVAVLVVTRLHGIGVYAMLVQIPVITGLNVFGLQ